PAMVDSSIITFLAASVFFNRLIVRRNQALAALRVSEAQFRNTWELAAAGVALLDRQGHVERLNPAMERILGYPSDAWRGVPFGYFVHPDEGVDLRARHLDADSRRRWTPQRCLPHVRGHHRPARRRAGAAKHARAGDDGPSGHRRRAQFQESADLDR